MDNNQENLPTSTQVQFIPEEGWINRNKTLLILLVIVAGVLVSGLYLWKYSKLIPKNQESTTEQSIATTTIAHVTPETFGFIIASTTDWKIENIDLNEPDSVQTFKYTSPDNKKSFTVSVFANVDPEKTTLNTWAKVDVKKYDSQVKESQELFEVGSNLGSIYSGEINGKIYKREYVIRGIEKQIYRISVEMDKNNSWMSDFDKIISSFSFIALDTNSYKIYKNIQSAFELTYPSNWRVKDESGIIYLRNYFNPTLDLPINPKDLAIRVMQNKNPGLLGIADWLSKNPFWTHYSKSKSFIKIDGNDAVKIYYEKPDMYYSGVIDKGYIYLIARGKDIISSEYLSQDGSPDPVLDKITMSIKFNNFDSEAYSTLVDAETKKIVGDDKNNDGVWDYVGDFINKEYANSQKIIAGLNQYTKVLQRSLIDNRDKEKSIKNANDSHRAVNCLTYIIGKGKKDSNSITEVSKITSIVATKLLNTEDRLKAYVNYDTQLGGSVFSSDNISKADCDFDLDKLPN